jgi:phosphatidate cytidylyltransferase
VIAPEPMSASPKKKRVPDLALRAVVGLALIAVAVVSIVVGGLLFWVVLALVGLGMMAEWADLVKVTPYRKRLAMLALFVPISAMCPLAWGPGFFSLGLLIGAAFFVVIVTNRRELAAGVLYVGLPVLGLLTLREHSREGIVFTFWAMALVWATDIGAYFTGRFLGGAKLAPAISPAKTWSGAIGGVVLATLFGVLMHYAYGLPLRLTLGTPVLAAVAEGGDLFESWLKRRAGVKDSGNLLPGHGGLMDRLDGLVPVAPLAALLSVMVGLRPW